MKKLALYILILCLFVTSCANAATKICVSSKDFGLGGVYTVYANPDETNEDESDLIRIIPRRNQYAPWVTTDLTTVSGAGAVNSRNTQDLRIYISGAWYPWGGAAVTDPTQSGIPECTMIPCDSGVDELCLPSGKKVQIDFQNELTPCYLTDGYGLYGLVSIDGTNPNTINYTNAVPSNHFRTFHLKTTGEDRFGKYVDVKYTEYCDKYGSCTTDLYGGQPHIIKGKLYFKILDSHYQDNAGTYTLRVVTGVYGSKGFIQSSVEIFEDTIVKVTQALYNGILNSNFVNIVRALLFFYIALSALVFSLGLSRQGQQDLIMRLFKIGVIVTLISPGSWDFFNNHLFKLFTEGSKDLGEIILRIVIFENQDEFPYPLPENANALSIMDSFVKMIISSAVWYKILSLLFNKYFLYFFGMIIALFFILMSVVRITMLYIIAIFAMAILLAVAPIFITMILFKMTTRIFDDWLKQLVSAAIMVVIISILSAMLILMVVDAFMALMLYGTCWDLLWSVSVLGINIFEIYWWIPQQDLSPFMNLENYGFFLILAITYHHLVGYIPSLVDALAGAARQPISAAYNAFTQRAADFYREAVASRIGDVVSYLPRKGTEAADEAFKKKTGLKTGIFEGASKAVSSISNRTIGLQQAFEQRFGHSDSFEKVDIRGEHGKGKGGGDIPRVVEGSMEAAKNAAKKYTGKIFEDDS